MVTGLKPMTMLGQAHSHAWKETNTPGVGPLFFVSTHGWGFDGGVQTSSKNASNSSTTAIAWPSAHSASRERQNPSQAFRGRRGWEVTSRLQGTRRGNGWHYSVTLKPKRDSDRRWYWRTTSGNLLTFHGQRTILPVLRHQTRRQQASYSPHVMLTRAECPNAVVAARR